MPPAPVRAELVLMKKLPVAVLLSPLRREMAELQLENVFSETVLPEVFTLIISLPSPVSFSKRLKRT